MEFLQGTTGEEVDAIKIALDRARIAAQEPLTEQITDYKGFIERAKKRLVKLEAERNAEHALLEEGRARLAWFEAQAAVEWSPSNTDCRVRSGSGSFPSQVPVVDPDSQDPGPKRRVAEKRKCKSGWRIDTRICKRQWLLGVFQKLPVSNLLTKAAQEWHQLTQQKSLMPSAVANSLR